MKNIEIEHNLNNKEFVDVINELYKSMNKKDIKVSKNKYLAKKQKETIIDFDLNKKIFDKLKSV